MARIPGLIWRPLPENATQPAIKPTQWIVHTAVDGPGPTNLGNYFERADITLESHTWLRWDRHEQLLDTTVRGDANYLANRRPDGTGAISTETEDDGTPIERPWNAYQLSELIRTGVLLNRLHGIPAVLPAFWWSPGMGYHSLYPDHWTNVRGKTCPGGTRIEQFRIIVLPGIQRALAQGVPMATTVAPYTLWKTPTSDAVYRVDAAAQSKVHVSAMDVLAFDQALLALGGFDRSVNVTASAAETRWLAGIPTVGAPVPPTAKAY